MCRTYLRAQNVPNRGTFCKIALRHTVSSGHLPREDRRITRQKKDATTTTYCDCTYLKSGNSLSSHTVSRIVLSATQSLTSVFGMGTGGSSASLSPEWLRLLDLKGQWAEKIPRFWAVFKQKSLKMRHF